VAERVEDENDDPELTFGVTNVTKHFSGFSISLLLWIAENECIGWMPAIHSHQSLFCTG
jgi:hypothetical protein